MLCELVADFQPIPKGGRPMVSKGDALAGIFLVLDNGSKWKDLPKSFGSKRSVHRWFSCWVKGDAFEKHCAPSVALLRKRNAFASTVFRVDGTFSKAKGGKGVKIMTLVDAKGLPVAGRTCSASPHESGLIQELFGFMLTKKSSCASHWR